jgi:hypothetical protein
MRVIGTSGSPDYLRDSGEKQCWPEPLRVREGVVESLDAESAAIVERLCQLSALWQHQVPRRVERVGEIPEPSIARSDDNNKFDSEEID